MTIGIGIRSVHTQDVLQHTYRLPFAEVIVENYLGRGGRMQSILEAATSDTSLLMHGVSLSLGSADEPDWEHVRKLRPFFDRWCPAVVSDHLCVTQTGGLSGHELWPLPFTEESVVAVAANIERVQHELGREFAVENVSSYVRFADDDMDEVSFLNAVCARANCGLLLDVNNLHVNGYNHGFDAAAALTRLDFSRVRQMHIAHHTHRTLPDGTAIIIDTHCGVPNDDVIGLWQQASQRCVVPTILEWDEDPPELDVMLSHVEALRTARAAIGAAA
jgi:uncharacterized protein